MNDDFPPLKDEEEFSAQQADIIADWGADRLLEDNLKRTDSIERIQAEENAKAQNSSGAKELFDDKNIDLKSELNPKEIVAASRLLFISERRNMPAFQHFITNLLRLKVSNARKGRREYIEGLHAEEKKEQGKDNMAPILELFRNREM